MNGFWQTHKGLVYTTIVAVFFVLSVFVRTGAWTQSSSGYRATDADAYRDYLIAKHIVTYQELPLVLHSSPGVAGSPLYFYLLSLSVLIKDSPVFLNWLNLLLQVGTLVVVYFLCREMFGRVASLLAVAFFCLSMAVVYQSVSIWQPWIMQPVANLSYLALLLAHKRKNSNFLIISAVLFTVAVALHSSVLAVAPVFVFLSFQILKKNGTGQLNRVSLGLAYLIPFLILFSAPILARVWQVDGGMPLGSLWQNSISTNPLELIRGVGVAMSVLVGHTFFGGAQSSIWFIFSLLGLVTMAWGVGRKDDGDIYYRSLVICIGLFICLASLVPAISHQPLPPHYFTPVFALFVIVLSASVCQLVSKFKWKWVLPLVAVVSLIYIARPTIYRNTKLVLTGVFVNPVEYLRSGIHFPTPSVAIQSIVDTISKRSIPIDGFQIRTYENGWTDNYATPIFIAQLENSLHTKLVTFSAHSNAVHNMDMVTSDRHIFLVCTWFYGFHDDTVQSCAEKFTRAHPYHQVSYQVYSQKPFTIFLASRVLDGN